MYLITDSLICVQGVSNTPITTQSCAHTAPLAVRLNSSGSAFQPVWSLSHSSRLACCPCCCHESIPWVSVLQQVEQVGARVACSMDGARHTVQATLCRLSLQEQWSGPAHTQNKKLPSVGQNSG